MWTSHYGSLAIIKAPLEPVSISRGKPRWLKGGWLSHVQAGTNGRNYDALAPTAAALKMDAAGYDAAFSAILRALDPRTVYEQLGPNAVLLCFCRPGQRCHRRIVAEWFEYNLGVIVPELGEDRLETPMSASSTYDFWLNSIEKRERLEKQLAGKLPVHLGPAALEAHKPGGLREQLHEMFG
jgi:hypothetical protein